MKVLKVSEALIHEQKTLKRPRYIRSKFHPGDFVRTASIYIIVCKVRRIILMYLNSIKIRLCLVPNH